MTDVPERRDDKGSDAPSTGRIVISVDAMGGDSGPQVVIDGMVLSAAKNSDIGFVLHGDEALLRPLVARQRALDGRCDVRHAPRTVTMEDKPSQIMRHGEGTSMWSAIDCVKYGEATVAVSCGNTGALMAVAMIRLKKLPGINRPAIGCVWPSRNPGGFNLMLDAGADVKAEPEDLMQYAMMGAVYARNGLGIKRPRVGLLNVGTEENKGRGELKLASELIAQMAEAGAYDYLGFVEGGDLPGDKVDVIVTDGFTGNVALKTGEGTAKLVSASLRDAFNETLMSKVAALFSLNALKRLQKKIDPRRVNGGVFLGLNGTVVKSHGSADATGVSSAIKLAFHLAEKGFNDRLAARVASATRAAADALDTQARAGGTSA